MESTAEEAFVPRIGQSEKQKFEFKTVTPVSTFRRILPQVLASGAKNLLIFDLSMAMVFPTVAIPWLTGEREDPNDPLRFTDFQASWFASIAFICQPIGSIMSGVVLEKLGRKLTMLLVNIPHIVAWLVIYNAQSLEAMFTADILLGLGVGFMEAPVLTYVGEIAEPSVRGVLTAIAGCSYALGCALLYTLGAVMHWRQTALVCCVIPIITMICISMVPETPLWLLSKGRRNQARAALQWLRGWVSYEHVHQEFEQIERYVEHTNLQSKDEENGHCVKDTIKELVRFNTRRPFYIILACFFFANFSAVNAMRPYFIQIFDQYNMVVDSNSMTIMVGISGFIATVSCSAGMKFLGKRKIALFSMASTTVFCLCLAVYTYRKLPLGTTSFSHNNLKLPYEAVTPVVIFLVSIVTVIKLPVTLTLTKTVIGNNRFKDLRACLNFCTNFGICSIPWVMISEIFPNKTRGLASGLVAAICYILSFISIKTYYELETNLSLLGVIILYTILGGVGTIFTYNCLPETEGRTLEEIEEHYSDKNNKITNHKIVTKKFLEKNCK